MSYFSILRQLLDGRKLEIKGGIMGFPFLVSAQRYFVFQSESGCDSSWLQVHPFESNVVVFIVTTVYITWHPNTRITNTYND